VSHETSRVAVGEDDWRPGGWPSAGGPGVDGTGLRVLPTRPPAASGPAGPGRTWWQIYYPVVVSGLVAAAGAVVWITAFPRVGTDLSAALARASWASRYPGSAYLFSWYGGIHPASYSVLAPYLLALTGTRLAMAVATVISAVLLALLLVRVRVPRPGAAALWGAAALLTELSAGRAAFTLGVAAALGCVVTAHAGRPRNWVRLLAIAALALLTCVLSPVAGLFLGIVAAVFALSGRRAEGVTIAVAAGLPLGAMAWWSDGGTQPIGTQSWVCPLLAVAAVLLLVPRRWPMVRAGAVIYGLGVILASAVPTPVGSNVARLGELLVGPLLVGMGRFRHRWLLPVALTAVAAWQVVQPTANLAQGNAPAYAPQTAALVRELRRLHADTARVEAVPQYGHWESLELASAAPLARGWERQVDVERNPLFYRGSLSPAAYHRWLQYNAVRYVAISAARPDQAAVAEAAIVREGQPWLVPVWHSSFWQLYRVPGASPLASAPATITSTTPAQITLRMSRAGTTVLRVRWSPLIRAAGAVAARDGPWTSLTVRRPGTYVLSAPY
jgi:hypothetical protein